MLKKVIENYVRKTKNRTFSFDENISTSLIFSFTFKKMIALLRSVKILSITKAKKKVFLGKFVEFFNKKNIVIGNNVNIGDFVKLYALGKKPLRIGNNVNIGSFSQVVISTTFNDLGEYIDIGNNVGIGEFSYLGGAGGLEIGDDTIIGQYFSAHPENHNYVNKDLLIREQGVNRKGIKIGSNCWLGSKVTILDGVTIGDNCIIAAGAVVTKSFPDNVVIGGVPAKILKERAGV
jgi:acetyltransferase-like isoleucine patch superfamily enzyme